MNEFFDLDYWCSKFPVALVKAAYTIDTEGCRVTSPVHLAIIEQLRRPFSSSLASIDQVPTQVFVFGKGEPTYRHLTKVGGVPYRPRTLPWPTTLSGLPLTFVAQFCFMNLDFEMPALPGDVLLVFARTDWPLLSDPDALRFEWYPSGLDDLLPSEMMPCVEWSVKPHYGVPHKAVDYPTGWTVFREIPYSPMIAVFEGTKIGGVPIFIPEGPDDVFPFVRKFPGTFLGTLGSLMYACNCPFPWVNQSSPIEVHWQNTQDDEKVLQWGDAGFINLFLTPEGKIFWQFLSY